MSKARNHSTYMNGSSRSIAESIIGGYSDFAELWPNAANARSRSRVRSFARSFERRDTDARYVQNISGNAAGPSAERRATRGPCDLRALTAPWPIRQWLRRARAAHADAVITPVSCRVVDLGAARRKHVRHQPGVKTAAREHAFAAAREMRAVAASTIELGRVHVQVPLPNAARKIELPPAAATQTRGPDFGNVG